MMKLYTLNVGTVKGLKQHNTSPEVLFGSCTFPGMVSDTGALKEELLRV